jgi:hypothetical protein
MTFLSIYELNEPVDLLGQNLLLNSSRYIKDSLAHKVALGLYFKQ